MTAARRWARGALAGCLVASAFAAAPDATERLKQLEEKNEALQKTLLQQQGMIEDLARKLSELTGKTPGLSDGGGDEAARQKYDFGAVRLSGEGGVGVYHTSGAGRFKNTDFRVDEAKLFLEAPLWENYVFAFAELDLLTRERQVANPADDSFHLGEAYVDFEGVSRLWGRPGMLGIRIGRIDIPFGEEYISRDVMDNPLISHSLSDIWGVDEGIEFYGKMGKFDYVFAVQNGGHPTLADFNRDKALVARVGWNPASSLRLSASAMRTGALDAANDSMSELWFGSGFIRALNFAATEFQANVYEADAQYKWKTGHAKAAGGYIDFSDNAGSRRDVYYYYIEALQRLPQHSKLYGAARFSQLFAKDGFPIVGNGNFGQYFFANPFLTDRMWRLSAGPGYNFSEHVSLKLEYTLDRRHVISQADAELAHFFGAEVGFSF